ncbi:MAG TPA: nicotinamide riboside transporter PnuC [Fimbriimonadaceae bacterium]|nr:nicotinamide riboside transporter PnuC [Fimbriimonadaceae bacterium]
MQRKDWREGAIILVACLTFTGFLYWRHLSGLLECLGFVAGVLGVWLATKENAWTYPVGLVNVGIYAKFFYESRLYADSVLNAIYFVLLCLGWYWWTRRRGDQHALKVKRAGSTILVRLGLVVVLTLPIVWWALIAVEGSIPYLDGTLSVLSLAAQFLQDRKFIQNWWVWIAVNVVYVPLFIWRGYYPTAVLYAVFLILAFRGHDHWKRQL